MEKTAYFGFDLIDVIAGRLVPNSAMTVENGTITWVGPADSLTGEQRLTGVDLTGKTVMPGMFNCHVHALATPIANPVSLNWEEPAKFALRGLNHLQQHLRSGVTFVRDMNGRKQAEVGLRDAINEGIVLGPHYYISRQCLCMTGGHGSNTGMECDGPDACRRAAREQIKYGADLIKIMASGGMMSPGMEAASAQLTEDEMRAAIEEAHKAGKKTATHAHGAPAVKSAIRAGIDSVEHGSFLDEECIELMLRHNVWLVPTISVDHWLFCHEDDGNIPAYAMEKCRRAHEAHVRSYQMALKAGVRIAAGTDAGTPYNPHWGSYMELVKMVEYGCSPMDAILSATINAARMMGVDDWVGSISPGKAADFLVLDEDPLLRIESLSHVGQVYLAGRSIKLDELRPDTDRPLSARRPL